MKAIQISIGRFHHFHLARQLEKRALLDSIYTGYPKFKLKDEQGIPSEKLKTFPWIQGPFMMRGKVGLDKSKWLNREWAWLAHQTLDKHVAGKIDKPSFLIALSGTGLYSGKAAQQAGGVYICDRGSSHIAYQNNLLNDEYQRWGLHFQGVDPRKIDKEIKEYTQADIITVPSEFVRRSFIDMGVAPEKIKKIIYGARLDRFAKVGDPDPSRFRVLWVGGVTVRKGFMYLLQAFQQIKHANKELLVVGHISPEVKSLLANQNLEQVKFAGILPNAQLPEVYSTSDVFVLPSIEEGLAMVQGEALACGCPVIASVNTGCEDLITDGQEGFIIPNRSTEHIVNSLNKLIDVRGLRGAMSDAALARVKKIGGWDTYGENYARLLNGLDEEKNSGRKTTQADKIIT